MTIHWKAVELYFSVVPFVFSILQSLNFGKFINFGLGMVSHVKSITILHG